MNRYQYQAIIKDLARKMVFLTGPRQAGKTTLAKKIAAEAFTSSIYLNYDSAQDRKIILQQSWISSTELIILDEIHKMPRWKNYLKGLFDTKNIHQKILVTGSARLEIFKKVGDSLAGRYYLHRLMPLSPAECDRLKQPYTLEHFLERGGFPEPFLAETNLEANRWRLQYTDSLIKEDILDFENINNLTAIGLVFELLKDRVGSPISYSSIAQDVAISPATVKKYIQILEALYIVFRVTPFSRNIARSILKEPKIYFFDIGLVRGDLGIRLENLVALSLLKHAYAETDYQAKPTSLHYLQTKEKQEVDFALAVENRLEKIIEVKLSDLSEKSGLGRGLRYFHEKYNIPALQIVKDLKHERIDRGIEVVQAEHFLRNLSL